MAEVVGDAESFITGGEPGAPPLPAPCGLFPRQDADIARSAVAVKGDAATQDFLTGYVHGGRDAFQHAEGENRTQGGRGEREEGRGKRINPLFPLPFYL